MHSPTPLLSSAALPEFANISGKLLPSQAMPSLEVPRPIRLLPSQAFPELEGGPPKFSRRIRPISTKKSQNLHEAIAFRLAAWGLVLIVVVELFVTSKSDTGSIRRFTARTLMAWLLGYPAVVACMWQQYDEASTSARKHFIILGDVVLGSIAPLLIGALLALEVFLLAHKIIG